MQTSVILAVPLSLGVLASAQSQEATNPFADKTIKIYIGNAAGGTYDFFGRLAARHMGRFIPGNPTIVPENMPGAGTIRAANFVYSAAPRDGTAMGIVAETVAVEQAIGNPAVAYDASKYTWIGRFVSSAGVHIMWHTSQVKTLEDAKRYEALTAGTGAGNVAETVPTLMNALLGTKFKIVRGYRSASDALLAIERGEVEGTAVNWVGFRSSKADWVRDNKVNVIFQYLPKRSPDLPNAPSLGDIGETDEAKKIFRLYGSMAIVGRSIFAAPDVPAKNAKILRDAFRKMVADPQVIKEVAKLGTDLDVASGEELQKEIIEVLDVEPRTIARVKAIFANK